MRDAADSGRAKTLRLDGLHDCPGRQLGCGCAGRIGRCSFNWLDMLLVAVVTLVGTGVSRWTYARIARRGSRPIDDEDLLRS